MFLQSRSLALKFLSPSGLLMTHCILPPTIHAFKQPIQNRLPNSSNLKSSNVLTFRPVVMQPFKIRSNFNRCHFSTINMSEDKKREDFKLEDKKREDKKESQKNEELLLSNDINNYIDKTIFHQYLIEYDDLEAKNPYYWSSFVQSIIDENPLLGYDPWIQLEIKKLKVYEKTHEVQLQKSLLMSDVSYINYICVVLPICLLISEIVNDIVFGPLFGVVSLLTYRFWLLICRETSLKKIGKIMKILCAQLKELLLKSKNRDILQD